MVRIQRGSSVSACIAYAYAKELPENERSKVFAMRNSKTLYAMLLLRGYGWGSLVVFLSLLYYFNYTGV